MSGERARLPVGLTDGMHYAKVDFTSLGSTVNIGDVPPCLVTEVYVAKTADFNAGSTATISVGIDYSDATSDATAALVSTAGLTSATALGPLEVTQVDGAAWKIDVASTITATLAATGTAATTGEAYVVIKYVADRDLNDLT